MNFLLCFFDRPLTALTKALPDLTGSPTRCFPPALSSKSAASWKSSTDCKAAAFCGFFFGGGLVNCFGLPAPMFPVV